MIKNAEMINAVKRFTHRELVEIAYRWVLNNTSCGIAVKEISAVSNTNEIPDVIGFGSQGFSVLIECKTSRSDFLSDKKKYFRQHPRLGMGRYRFYLAPKDVIRIPELPDGWGLVEVNDKGKARCVYGREKTNITLPSFEYNVKAEHSLMYSLLRRLHIRDRLKEVYEGIPDERKKDTKQSLPSSSAVLQNQRPNAPRTQVKESSL
ncbi:unnamed protein product [Leptospira phage LE1]|uniref:Uncharacterized protein n=1 Tax=Leptospira phage LE1 TaxID=137511 RepID=Q6NDX9_9CAUD|nr:hypothetical protein HWD53_gp64 [Leptospira phage LE1]CAE14763.1 unnamed protein product [Leptospira phage LE1]